MIVETIQIKEISAFSELFLGISIIYLIVYGTFISFNKKNQFPLLQHSMIYLAILVIAVGSIVCLLMMEDLADPHFETLSHLSRMGFTLNKLLK